MIDFEMFTDEGNAACTQALENIKTVINGDKFVSKEELDRVIKAEIAQINSIYKEVHDTEPEYHFESRINKALESRGYAYRVSRWEF